MNTRPSTTLFSLIITVFLCVILPYPIFAECIKGDCQNGSGTFVFPGGSKYIGEWKNGQMNGQGMFISSSGAKYSGEWQEGELTYNSDLEISESKKASLPANKEKLIQNSDIEKRLFDPDFDPSAELSVPAGPRHWVAAR